MQKVHAAIPQPPKLHSKLTSLPNPHPSTHTRRARTRARRATVPAEFRRQWPNSADSHLENNEQQIWRVSSFNFFCSRCACECALFLCRGCRIVSAFNIVTQVWGKRGVSALYACSCTLLVGFHTRWNGAIILQQLPRNDKITLVVWDWVVRYSLALLSRGGAQASNPRCVSGKMAGGRARSLGPNCTGTREAS